MTTEETGTNAVELATELTIAWLGNSNTRATAEEASAFLQTMNGAITSLSAPADASAAAEAPPQAEGAVSVRKSLASPDHIISMIDGKPYKTLRRHLARHGMTPEQYRERFGLRGDYPMVSPNYSETRRTMAKRIGLGTKANRTGAAEQAQDAEAPAKRGRGRPRG